MNARLLASLAAAASFVLGSELATAQTAAGTEERITRNSAGHASEHAADELRDSTSFELLRREPGEIAVRPRVSASGKGAQSLRSFGDSWVYDATTDLFADRDDDGYYSFLRVRFDVDTDEINAVLRRLTEIGVRTLVSQPPSLEELFLRLYEPEKVAAK